MVQAHSACLKLAQNGHTAMAARCLPSEVKRKSAAPGCPDQIENPSPALGRVLARTIRPGLIFEFLHRHRPAEQIALCEVHSERSQQFELLAGLHAFGG